MFVQVNSGRRRRRRSERERERGVTTTVGTSLYTFRTPNCIQPNKPRSRRQLSMYHYCINPLKLKLVQIIFKNSVRTAKKTLHFTITKINWLTLFKEIIAFYSENHMKPTKKQNAVLLIENQVVHIVTTGL
jgi:hypothetical protein